MTLQVSQLQGFNVQGISFTPVSSSYGPNSGTSATTGTETIPTGASSVVIKVYGPGGSGGISATGGGGGGGGGYALKTLALTSSDWGKTFSVTVGNGRGGRSTVGAGFTGNTSSVASGTYTLGASIVGNAGSGGGGFSGGAGGTGTGGDTNVTGSTGSAGYGCICSPIGGDGGSSNSGEFAGGTGGSPGVPGLAGGGGGAGGTNGTNGDGVTSGPSGGGYVIFSYT